jgi:hypothetical protein
MQRYRSVSTLKLPAKCRKILEQPVLDNELSINSKGWLFMKKEAYLQRLNKAFPDNYSLVRSSEIKQIANTKYQLFTLYVNNCFVSEAFGECEIKMDKGQLEYTALVRTCKDLLVASELWDSKIANSLRDRLFVKKYEDRRLVWCKR